MSKYWQHDETGRIAITRNDVDLSPRYYEISQEAYEHIEAAAQQSVQADICPECGGKELYSLRGDLVICWKCDGTGKCR